MNNPLNVKSIVKVLGHLVFIEGMIMTVPLAVCLIYGESDWKAFAIAIAIALLAAMAAIIPTEHTKTIIKAREGFIITALIWIVYGFFGMIPFMLSSAPLSLTDAIYETISGFTTTGVSAITDVEAQSHGILFWRALTQWIGGLGIILFLLAMMPEHNKSAGLSMFNAEATGITHDKLHPRIRQTVLSLWGIYAILTLISIILLWIGPMNLFDAVCQSFAAIATGGFTTHNQGISFWHSNYVFAVLTVIMFVGGINFMVLYSAWKNGIRVILRNEVTRTFALIIMVCYLLFIASFLLRGETLSIENYLFLPLFHILSAITTTGFSISNAETWGSFALLLTILLMFCGSCAGSTAGAIKVDRIIVLCRNLINQVKKYVYPKRVYVVNLNGSFLQGNLISRVSAFVWLYLIILTILTGITALYGYTLTDSLFMSASCIGCNGLGYGVTGINGSYACLPAGLKWFQCLAMLIGRLELFTFAVLLLPSFWRK